METIVIGNIRVQLLCDGIVRIEYAAGGKFFDGDTFFIPDKAQFAKTSVVYSVEENVICFGDYELYIPQNARSLKGVRLEKNGKKVYVYKKLRNSGELPPLDITPDVFALSDTPRIVIPEGGYSVERSGEYAVRENAQDIYLLLCGGNARKLRWLYVELTGRPELVRLSALGGWNSKYYPYTEAEAKQLILDYEKHDVPLDVMVIDTDWRSCEHGWGYDVNTELFPDMKGFLDFAHAHNVEIMFNDHPEPVDGAQVFAPEEIAYRERNLTALLDMGVDIWWYDRNWNTSLVSPTDNVRWETFGLYLFRDITERYHKRAAGDRKIYRRPVIMGNAVNIKNGDYLGIFDSASHRYSVQWTGDITCYAHSLTREVSNLVRGGNNAIPYINADCGGHIGTPDKLGFIRWMQFGTLSPVFRPHCTRIVERTREPWVYDVQTLDIVREYVNLRYRLLPVIYKGAYESYAYGEPIFKSLGFEYPDDKKAARLTDEYMLGNNIIISPIGGEPLEKLARKYYTAPVSATFYDGKELKGAPLAHAEYDMLDMDLDNVPPENGVPVYNFSARLITSLMFDRDVNLWLNTDDGATVKIDGVTVLEDKTEHAATMFRLAKLSAGREYKVEVEYFQAGGVACCMLYAEPAAERDKHKTYLPKGKWIYPFDGSAYNGKRTVEKTYPAEAMPLFVRAGALIPLAYAAHNTAQQKWDRLVLDWYADKQSSDRGYLYEDDGQTTAYKYGKYRTTAFAARYTADDNAYVLNIEKAKGAFDGDRCFEQRTITVKRHVFGERAAKVTVNGKQVEITRADKKSQAFPLNTCAYAPDGDTELITFVADADTAYEIKFYL